MQFDVSRDNRLQAAAAPGVGALMRDVLYALVPGTAVFTWFFGWGVITNVLFSIVFAVLFEAIALRVRRRSVAIGLSDYSAVVTAWLFALALPPMSSWWLIAVGIGFGIVVAKHVYGGLGYNPFNPAMVAYVVLLISFPREMTLWLDPKMLGVGSMSFTDTWWVTLGGDLPVGLNWDTITGATPLDSVKTELIRGFAISEIETSPIFGSLEGSGWEWMSLTWLAGGIWLIYRKVITWHIPVALLLSLSMCAAFFALIDSESYADPTFHLLSGAAMLGAFFIATDPVTAASSNRGRLVYGAGIGVLTYVIRTWGGYPEGIAFAVLLANLCAPTIDYYTRPRAYGH